MRRLTAHERALWSRVAASVRPLPGKALPELPATPIAAPAPAPPAAKVTMTADPRPAARPPLPSPVAATLDGGWDRKISRGRLTPDRVIDLHGFTLDDAHAMLMQAIHADDGARVILVVTGKGRADRPGRIRTELAHWLERPDMRGRVAALRGAHPRHGGSGAFYLILKRRG